MASGSEVMCRKKDIYDIIIINKSYRLMIDFFKDSLRIIFKKI